MSIRHPSYLTHNMESLARNTIIRYHPKDGSDHYTAVMLEDEVLEVKRAGLTVKQTYPNVDKWIESLPGSPVLTDLVFHLPGNEEDRVEEEKEEAVKAVKPVKPVKAVKEKKKATAKFNLVSMKEPILSTRWTLHLHRMMKEANPALLKREDVILAFNALVDVLLEYQSHVYSCIPSVAHRYRTGVDIEKNTEEEPLKDMCEVQVESVHVSPETSRVVIRNRYYRREIYIKEEKHIRNRIVEAYMPLFALIREDVLPYMERRNAAFVEKKTDVMIQRIVDRMERLQAKHQEELEKRQTDINQFVDRHDREIALMRTTIAMISEKRNI